MILKSRRARKWTLVVASVLVVVLGVGYALLRVADSRTFQFFGSLVDRVDTTEKIVAITFDDGPDPAGTRTILDTLKSRQVPATFFLIGREIAAHPGLAHDIAAAGHEIGNHSFSHDRMIGVTPAWVADEVEATDALIRTTGYTGEILFRPPERQETLRAAALPRRTPPHHDHLGRRARFRRRPGRRHRREDHRRPGPARVDRAPARDVPGSRGDPAGARADPRPAQAARLPVRDRVAAAGSSTLTTHSPSRTPWLSAPPAAAACCASPASP